MKVESKAADMSTNSSEPITGASVDDIIKRSAEDDMLVRFFIEKWRQLLFSLIAVGVVALVWFVIKSSSEQRSAASADLFERVREHFAEYERAYSQAQKDSPSADKTPSTDNKGSPIPAEAGKDTSSDKIGEAHRKLSEKVRVLTESSSPYPRLAELYAALAYITEQRKVAHDKGTNFGKEQYLGIKARMPALGSMKDEERFLAELGLLMVARSLADLESVSSAQKALSDLATSGKYVNVAAGVSLALLASSDADKAAARSILENIRTNHPEQGDLIKSELERLGVKE